MLPQQCLEFHEHSPRQQPPVATPRPQTPERRPLQWTPETHPLSGLEFLGLVMLDNPPLAMPTLWGAEVARNTLDVDENQQLLGESAGGDHFPDVPLPDVPPPEVGLDHSVGAEWTSPHIAEETMVVGFTLGSDPCLVHFLLVESVYLRHWLSHTSRGFWIAQGSFHLCVMYWFDLIRSNMGRHACSIIATPGV